MDFCIECRAIRAAKFLRAAAVKAGQNWPFNMLNKKNRLGNSDLIGSLARKGKQHKGEYITFRFAGKKDLPSEFAVTISKKIANKAVVRNRLRRQIMEILRLNLDHLPLSIQDFLIARPPILQAS